MKVKSMACRDASLFIFSELNLCAIHQNEMGSSGLRQIEGAFEAYLTYRIRTDITIIIQHGN